jgi:hypothetical protein
MDPLSVSASAAGLLSLAVGTAGILQSIIDGAQSAPEEAQNLLAEITTLSDVLQDLVQFLRTDHLTEQRFEKTSVLRMTIESGQDRLKLLYAKLDKLRASFEGNKLKVLVARLTWPLKKEEYEQTLVELQRTTQTFQLSLATSNGFVIFFL